MPRVIWKGAISFGLVHVPVALYPGSQDVSLDFDWLDKRSMDPVGYKRINKRTGKEIAREHIVKGLKQASGEYAVLSEDEIKAAYPKSTQTIEIESFIKASELPFGFMEKPYYLAPLAKAEKVYGLLREAMRQSDVIGIARVVMHTRESLAALIVDDDALLLNTLRWPNQIRPRDELKFPASGKNAGLKEAELKMARQLIGDMVTRWDPSEHEDRFTASIHALAEQKLKAGEGREVTPLEDEAPAESSNVVDLAALLRQSLSGGKRAKAPAGEAASGSSAGPPRKAARKATTKAANTPTRKAATKQPATRKQAAKPSRKAA